MHVSTGFLAVVAPDAQALVNQQNVRALSQPLPDQEVDQASRARIGFRFALRVF